MISANNVTLRIGKKALFEDVNIKFTEGNCYGLIGANGAGKSTLMKVLTGIYQKDSGSITYKGKETEFHNTREAQDAGVVIVHQELNMVGDLTVAQNIFIGREPKKGFSIDDKKMIEDSKKLFQELNIEINPKEKMNNLTVGKQQMCEIAKAISHKAEVIIFDEPSAALTEKEIADLFEIIRDLRKKGLGIVYISHRMDEIKVITDRVTVMRDGTYVGTLITKESTKDILENLLKRSPNNYGKFEAAVDEILNKVKTEGDAALFAYTKEFDKTEISADTIKVTEEEIKEAYEAVDPALIDVIRKALVNIRSYHEKQRQNSWFTSETNGTMLGQKVTALERVGVYVPGGKAVYPSSVLMNIVPAKVAGVDQIVMTTPPGKDGKVNPSTLVAAKEAGADEIYKVGGAQAIGALAYGTESIPKVDKIVGPGNIFVALAKKAVYGYVSIDSIAGPSEILVLADETANPRYVAADLLSQAEHDELASAILVTTSEKLAHEVSDQVDGFLKELSRAEIISKSLDNYGYILLADTMEDVIDVANEIASEHLEIQTKNPFEVMTKIRNAGAIFIGEYASEPLGDYFAGPNHILPTNGTAKFFSPLSVDDFIKKSSIISYSREALQKVHKDIESFAKAEQLTAHANSMKVRFEDNQEG